MKQRMRSAWQLWRGQARTAKLCLALAALSVAAALLLSSGTLCYAVSSQDLVREQAITPAAQPTRQLTGAESPGIQTTAAEPTEPAETPPNRAAGRHAACRCFDLARHRAHHLPFRPPDHLRWGRFSSGLGHRRPPGDAHCGGGRGTSHLVRRKRLLWQPHPDRPRQRLRYLLRPLLGASGGGGGLGGAGADHRLGRFNGPLHRPPLPF